MVNLCFTCGKSIPELKTFCNKECYFRRKNYRKQSEETRRKIASGNSKPMSLERKLAISKSRLNVPSKELLEKLQWCWSLGYLNPLVIKDLCGIKRNGAFYNRLVAEYCRTEQHKFMPSDWYPEDYEKLIELASQGIWYQTIAKILSSSLNQVVNISKKLGLPINTHKPDPWSSSTSKIESEVLKWLKDEEIRISQQFSLGKFYFDAHVIDTNVLIEVNGDYWHCNPRVYLSGPINEMQKRMMRRDFAKKAFAKSKGYKLITVWENDVRKDSSSSKQWVLKKIKEYS